MEKEDINIKLILSNLMNNDKQRLYKSILIFNAIESGWTIKKNENKYIFSKYHQNKKEVLDDNYLTNFIIENIT